MERFIGIDPGFDEAEAESVAEASAPEPTAEEDGSDDEDDDDESVNTTALPISEVKGWVGHSVERAQEAFEAEVGAARPRSTLVAWLDDVIHGG